MVDAIVYAGCRHYWDIDPVATADYIKAYREHWDSEEHERPA